MNLLPFLCALALSPLLAGLVGRVKAWFAGRRGPSWLQAYRDLSKLFAKGAVLGETGTPALRAAPLVVFGSTCLALLPLPGCSGAAALSFGGDMLALAGLLALGRFALVLGALDTGSSFEGMGAAREAFFGALAEPAFFLFLLALSRLGGSASLAPVLARLQGGGWMADGAALLLLSAGLFVLLLTENARLPVDDPATHLELTMVHEVMVLDSSGPDLGLLEYASALKLWIYCSLLASLLCPLRPSGAWAGQALTLAGVALLGLALGLVESLSARLRLNRVALFVSSSFILMLLALARLAGGF